MDPDPYWESGFAWIRIKLNSHGSGSGSVSVLTIAILDPDPDPGAQKLTIINKYSKTKFQHLKKTFVPTFVCFMTYCLFKYIFQAKIQLFVMAKSEQESGPDLRIRIEVTSWIQLTLNTN
jgi:hypothetical protein